MEEALADPRFPLSSPPVCCLHLTMPDPTSLYSIYPGNGAATIAGSARVSDCSHDQRLINVLMTLMAILKAWRGLTGKLPSQKAATSALSCSANYSGNIRHSVRTPRADPGVNNDPLSVCFALSSSVVKSRSLPGYITGEMPGHSFSTDDTMFYASPLYCRAPPFL